MAQKLARSLLSSINSAAERLRHLSVAREPDGFLKPSTTRRSDRDGDGTVGVDRPGSSRPVSARPNKSSSMSLTGMFRAPATSCLVTRGRDPAAAGEGRHGAGADHPSGNIEHIQLNSADPWTAVDGERASIKTRHPFFSDPAVR